MTSGRVMSAELDDRLWVELQFFQKAGKVIMKLSGCRMSKK